MSLYNRIVGSEDPKILWHQFQATLTEWEAGFITRADVIALNNITPAEEADLDSLKSLYTTSISRAGFRASFDNAGLMAEVGWIYTTKGLFNQRLLAASDDWLSVQKYTVAQLPAATPDSEGHVIYVQDGAAGSSGLAFSNGSQWLRVDNLQPVSAS